MVQVINVPSTIDDTVKLQNLINTTGNVPTTYTFTQDDILINSLVRLYNYTIFAGQDVKFTLMEDADPNVFGIHIPFFGSKYNTGTTNLEFFGFSVDGLRDHQEKVPDWNGHSGTETGKKWGQGYHDVFLFNNVNYLKIHDIEIKDILGDGLRVDNFSTSGICGSNIDVHNVVSSRYGHDLLHFRRCNKVIAYGNNATMDVGNVLRVRNCTNLSFYNNVCDGTMTDYGPCVQLENTDPGAVSSSIYIYNNVIEKTMGPGIWFLGGNNTTKTFDIVIRNNLIRGCGTMFAANKIADVGGIGGDGFNVKIYNNTIDSCLGYGIFFGNYVGQSSITNSTADVKGNIITNTKKSNYPDANSGTAIANLLGHYTVTSNNNCIYNNLAKYVNINYSNDMYVEPCYVGNGEFHLRSKGGHYTPNGLVFDNDSSPCIFTDHELGCYNGTNQMSVYYSPTAKPNEIVGNNSAVIIVCNSSSEAQGLLTYIKNSNILTDETITYYSP